MFMVCRPLVMNVACFHSVLGHILGPAFPTAVYRGSLQYPQTNGTSVKPPSIYISLPPPPGGFERPEWFDICWHRTWLPVTVTLTALPGQARPGHSVFCRVSSCSQEYISMDFLLAFRARVLDGYPSSVRNYFFLILS